MNFQNTGGSYRSGNHNNGEISEDDMNDRDVINEVEIEQSVRE